MTCRTPWGESESANAAIQQMCSTLEAEGISLPTRGCRCADCRVATVGQDQAFERRYGDSKASEIHRLFLAAVSQAQRAPDMRAFVEARTWSDFLVPLLWMAAAADDNTGTWPAPLEQICSHVPAHHESGLALGARSVVDAWDRIRTSLRAEEVDCMEDLRIAIRNARGEITAWIDQDSRFAGSTIADDHFNVSRGAHLESYIQEWLFVKLEGISGSNIGTLLSANLQSAVLRAAQAPEQGSSSLASTFVQSSDLVTGSGWRQASVNSGSRTLGDEPASSTNNGDRTGTDANIVDVPSRRRRRDEADDGSHHTTRLYCPVESCPRHDRVNSAGWTCMQSLRDHLMEHVSGRLDGDIPSEFLRDNDLTICVVCNRLLSTRFGTVCPRCRPEFQRNQPQATSGRAVPADYPSFEEVFRSNIRCKSYVPSGAKHLWAQCLVGAMAAVLRHKDELAWLELFMLPKAVLRAGDRGGKKHHARLDAETRRRCQEWLDGHRAQLWRPPQRPRGSSRRRARSTPAQRRERAIELVKEEMLGKACGALIDAPPAAVTNEILSEMREKHPGARAPDGERMRSLREVHAAAVSGSTPEAVLKAIKSFPRGSAAGPSGLRPQHLRDALVRGMRDEVLQHSAELTTLLARGRAPTGIAQWICGASLVALPKPQGGHRPVAVGETWRRLTAKILCADLVEDIRDHLEPVQLGVGSKAACEAIVHVTRQWCSRHAADRNKCLVKMDLSNAFNCVDRSAVLHAVRRVVPELVPWADFCYRNPSRLRLDDKLLLSARGVQQGDPLGPALFALAIHEAVMKAKREVQRTHRDGVDFTVFYLDDGVVAGSDQADS